MAQFKIFIDSTGDLPKDLRDEYDIDYCPMIVTVDEKEIVASLDYDQGYTLKQFYDVMREGRRIFTSQVPDQVFVEKFTAALEAGEDILYIACSSKLSASVLAGEKVAQKLREEYPNRKIVVFDSKIACYGQGEMAIFASKMRKEGKSIVMISEELMELIGMCDRIIIMKDGEINGEIMRDKDMDENTLIAKMV